MVEYKFTKEELQGWFMDHQIIESNLDFLVKCICKYKKLSFDKYSNIRVETYDTYAPKLIFDYNENIINKSESN